MSWIENLWLYLQREYGMSVQIAADRHVLLRIRLRDVAGVGTLTTYQYACRSCCCWPCCLSLASSSVNSDDCISSHKAGRQVKARAAAGVQAQTRHTSCIVCRSQHYRGSCHQFQQASRMQNLCFDRPSIKRSCAPGTPLLPSAGSHAQIRPGTRRAPGPPASARGSAMGVMAAR